MTNDDKRLIEDYLPIEAISAEAQREKGVRSGHIRTLHLWWARRPLVACRAAVYGALVPASQFIPDGAQTDEKKKSLGRANAAKFVRGLCQYPGSPHFISEAQHHILKAHAERLTREIDEWKRGKAGKPAWVDESKFTSKEVTVEDISAGRAPRPRVVDMFAGGGAIPLEALRLGCEAYAMDLNPVAYIIELCTLLYPQKYGRPDPNVRGMTGPKNAKSESSWGGLAEEVRYWGEWVLHKVKAETGDLYPLIPDPNFKGKRPQIQGKLLTEDGAVPAGYLVPLAYLWARTVQCKQPHCRANVPLFGQLWLRRKLPNATALTFHPDPKGRLAHFRVRKCNSLSTDHVTSGFEVSGTETSCPFCHSTLDGDYIRQFGPEQGYGQQLMAIVCDSGARKGKTYLAGPELENALRVTESDAARRAATLTQLIDTTPLDAEVLPTGNAGYATGKSYLHGVKTFRQCFSARQQATLFTFAKVLNELGDELEQQGLNAEHILALRSFLVLLLSQSTNRYCSLTRWNNVAESVADFSSMKRFALSWDWPEVNPWSNGSGNFRDYLNRMVAVIKEIPMGMTPHVARGSATEGISDWPLFDAVVTDPPYYDNESYAELSDMFYVWHRIVAKNVFPEHLATANTPKKKEVIAAAYRQGGTVTGAKAAYLRSFIQALRVANTSLKNAGMLVLVYAHKTTAGWTSMISALREAEFQISEAWPLDTEKKGRAAHQDDAALASSIFLTARKRDQSRTSGSYERQVRGELEEIVRERVETLWQMGVSGADLVIACVGAGLRAFTRFARVEYANGEEVPAEHFLTEVETVVLDTVLQKLSKVAGGNGSRSRSLAGLDSATRFYVLWRYTYGWAELDAGEAIIFANGTHVELDGPLGLSSGSRSLVEKKKAKYKLRDFADRGDDDDLGLPDEDTGESRATIDVLHRLLWLLEKRPPLIPDFIADANPNLDQLRLVAQALAGPALKGGELENISPTAEQSALGKLLANWSTVMEGKAATQDRRAGQQQLRFR